jgi:sec-independent protein translocase protein TatB
MFGIDSGELLIIAVVALVVIGPKDLPRVMRTLGNFMGRARGMARHFRSGLDTMMREAEFEEMEKKWKADNERIMREHPTVAEDSDWGQPAPEAAPPAMRPKPPPLAPAAPPPTRSAPPIPPAPPSAGEPS